MRYISVISAVGHGLCKALAASLCMVKWSQSLLVMGQVKCRVRYKCTLVTGISSVMVLTHMDLKKIYSTKYIFVHTKYNNSQSRLLIRQETLIEVHMHRLHKGHQRSKQVYHAVSLSSCSVFTCIKIWRWIRSHGTNDWFKKILRTYWTGG